MTDKLREAAECIESLLELVDDLMPGIANISVPDYAKVNDVPIRARRCLVALTTTRPDAAPPKDRDALVDEAVNILWKWMHEADPGGPNRDQASAVGAITGEIVRLRETELKLRKALIEHRADLHGWSSRPCPTCRESAEVLGIAGMVPGSCARGDTDRNALDRR